jgi:heterotetrameric sarcosine oxidase gamma subunit
MLDLKKNHPLGNNVHTPSAISDQTDLTLSVVNIPALIQVFAKKNQTNDLAKKLGIVTKPGQACDANAFTALPVAPGQWILISKDQTSSEFGAWVSKTIDGLGYVSEQSDSRVCIRISGSKAHDIMTRGCRLDLHSSIVSKGFCAQTIMAQIGVLMHIVDDGPVYDLYVYSGFARSFWHWLTETASQFEYYMISEGFEDRM